MKAITQVIRRMPLGWASRPADVFAELPTSQLRNATVLITGPTSGVGEAAAAAFASCGCHLVLCARSEERVQAMMERRKLSQGAKVTLLKMDLSSLESVKACADGFLADQASRPPLKVLVLNAGLYNFSGTFQESADGFESTFATNHLGHFLLTSLLMPALKASAPSRVVVVSSGSHFGPHTTTRVEEISALEALARPSEEDRRRFGHLAALRAYGSSKLANTCFAKAIHARHAAADGVTACSLHPGTLIATGISRDSAVATFFFRRVLSWFTKDQEQGASTTLYCSLVPHEQLEGGFFSDCKPQTMSKLVTDAACNALWDASRAWCRGFMAGVDE